MEKANTIGETEPLCLGISGVRIQEHRHAGVGSGSWSRLWTLDPGPWTSLALRVKEHRHGLQGLWFRF